MRIIMIGPPSSHKRALAKEIQISYPKLTISKPVADLTKTLNINSALSDLSDYRAELLVGSIRAIENIEKDDTIFVHTVLDSLAHTIARVMVKDLQDPNNFSWIYTMEALSCMVRDSLRYDVAIRFDINTNDKFSEYVDATLESLVTELDIGVVAPDDAMEIIANLTTN